MPKTGKDFEALRAEMESHDTGGTNWRDGRTIEARYS